MNNLHIVKVTVTKILQDCPKARDSDDILCVKVWQQDKERLSLDAVNFFDDFKAGRYTTAESITRSRRKLQELHIELRGEMYEHRHEYEDEIINQLKLF